jgi:hypothetical protein
MNPEDKQFWKYYFWMALTLLIFCGLMAWLIDTFTS